jgi:hypothetical protein
VAGILFNGTTSKIEWTSGTGLDVPQFTFLCWARPSGFGENGRGRLFGASEAGGATEGFAIFNRNAVAALSFLQVFTPGPVLAQWACDWTVGTGVWHPISITYDRTATGNDPVMRVDFATGANFVQVQVPSGTAVSPTSGYCIGNTTAQDRTFDGALMHMQFHPTILSTANQDKALKYPGTVRTVNALWWPLLTSSYTRHFSWNGTSWGAMASIVATATATHTTDSPACQSISVLGHAV